MKFSNTKHVIGVDLGGTNVRAAVIDDDGNLLDSRQALIEAERGPEAGLSRIRDLIAQGIDVSGAPVLAIGIGSTGPLDRERGCIQNPYTLPGWEDVSIVNFLEDAFDLPVALENDADAAALGEYWMGAGEGCGQLLMVTLGTGVGTGMIRKGEVMRGVDGAHPEGGHILIDPSGPPCYCGARGCWESLVSGTAIGNLARGEVFDRSRYLKEASDAVRENVTALMVFDGARKGDPACLELVDQTAVRLGQGLVSCMMLYLPDCIVIGGGVARSFHLMEPKMREVIAQHNVIIPAEQVKIRLARLGQKAGLYGAAHAALGIIRRLG